MSREYIKRLMSTLFEKLKLKYSGNSELKILINTLDESGCGLLHYIAALNYHELIQIMHDYSANLSLKTATKKN